MTVRETINAQIGERKLPNLDSVEYFTLLDRLDDPEDTAITTVNDVYKYLWCIDRAKNTRYQASADELFAICPDSFVYFEDTYLVDYGLSDDRVTVFKDPTHKWHIPQVDHTIAESRGGSLTIDNLQILPANHNLAKSNLDLKERIMFAAAIMDECGVTTKEGLMKAYNNS